VDEAAFLARLTRARDGAPAAHPGAYAIAGGPAPSWESFRAALEAVGGRHHAPVSAASIAAAVAAVVDLGGHKRVVATPEASALLRSAVPGVETYAEGRPPHSWQDVDLAVLFAEGGVCENAALLFSSASLAERALLFLAQHVLVILDLGTLHADLHQGARAMAARGLPIHHLTWVSGPSKTADIEQTLVIGAHGCRSLMVLPILPDAAGAR
jgi:L-lactate dehydrogenase complex protein LldG